MKILILIFSIVLIMFIILSINLKTNKKKRWKIEHITIGEDQFYYPKYMGNYVSIDRRTLTFRTYYGRSGTTYYNTEAEARDIITKLIKAQEGEIIEY